ncbi:glycosyltransferase family 1 protein [uncultured Clostridium sp.]|uniref:glycosyltransferase family 1 protein n=1 Tax=uncultured Clostridium sp. TaxID=59620 RepID=UPI0025CEFB6D|nr:glycosyltransferase family 1 protein [uncultured Clostridium sp.]
MKIAIVSTVGLIYDGITSVIMTYLNAMDLSDLDIYIIGTIEVKPSIRSNLEKLGCKVIYMPSRRINTISYFMSLVRFIRKNKIKVIHAHGNSGTLAIEMLAGWLGGCKVRIAHSHNTRCDQVKADKLLRPLFNILYTKAVACSKGAGVWLFGNRKFTVLNNGRNIERFSYNVEVRNKVRNELGIGDSIAIGHVGGFVPQKNHKFLLEIYKSILEINPDVKLFMIGDGLLRAEIERKAFEYGIKDKIIFTGNSDCVQDLLQAMDGMLLPSFFEGLPLVTVEWQISGLPCVISDSITKECALTELVEFCSLNSSPDEWALKILNLIHYYDRGTQNKFMKDKVIKSGFDIRENADKLRSIYFDHKMEE